MESQLPRATAKLNRALAHFQNLKSDVTEFFDTRSYRVVPEFNHDHTQGDLRLELNGAPKRWGLVIGDCVHNLRSALDHAVNELAVHHTGSDTPPDDDKLQFPILTDRLRRDGTNTWDHACRRYRIDTNHLSQAAIDVIEAAQPYHRTGDTWALRWIQHLDDTDKHRTVNPVPVVIDRALFSLTGDLPIDNEGHTPTLVMKRPFVFEDQAIVGGFTSKTPCPNVDVDCELAMQIGVSELPLPNGATTTLAYEPLFARLGNATGRLLNNLSLVVTPRT